MKRLIILSLLVAASCTLFKKENAEMEDIIQDVLKEDQGVKLTVEPMQKVK